VGPQSHGPGQKGVKRSLLVESDGGPLGTAIAGANVHDTKLVADTLEAIAAGRTIRDAEGWRADA
jgi:hypothetical protein